MRLFAWSAAGLTLALASTASAQSAEPPPPRPVAVPVASPDEAPRALADEELAGLNGRQGSGEVTVLTDQDISAVNRGNTVRGETIGSGQITMNSGAFEGFGGVGNFVVNSGHNNNLQGAITINIVQP